MISPPQRPEAEHRQARVGLGRVAQPLKEGSERQRQLAADLQNIRQGGRQLAGGLKPPARFFGEAAVHRPRQGAVAFLAHGCQRGRRPGDVLGQDLGRRGALERQPRAGREVSNHAQRVDVAPLVRPVALRLFGTHVGDRAQDLVLPGDFGLGADVGDPEVGHQRAAAAVLQQDVLRLQVAVDDALRVRVAHGPGHVAQHPGRPGRGERARGADPVCQRLPVHVGHGEEDERAHLVHGEDGDDVGMRQLGRGARLA